MSMNKDDFAQYVHDEMGFPGSPSDDIKGWCQAIVNELSIMGLVSNLPGTIMGEAPPSGGPLINGSGTNGVIAGITKESLSNRISTNIGKPITLQLEAFCDAIVTHIITLGRVVFSSGSITGICTNTLISPGVFTGSGSNGKIVNLDGNILAALVKDKVGYPTVSLELIKYCTAIVDYIKNSASIQYSTCTGSCLAGGGPLASGYAVGGIIS